MIAINKSFVAFGFFLMVLALAPAAARAQQAAPPRNVNVVNTADVNVVNTPNVTVANTADVRVVGASAPDAFQHGFDIFFPDGQDLGHAEFEVPAGKRLVIEYVSVSAPKLREVGVATVANGTGAFHRLAVDKLATGNFAADKLVRMYADGGTRVQVETSRGTTVGSGHLFLTISGYFTDLSPAAQP